MRDERKTKKQLIDELKQLRKKVTGMEKNKHHAKPLRIEKIQQETELLLKSTLDTSPSCIFVKDFEGKYVFVNHSIAQLYGTTPEDMIGKTDLDFVKQLKLTKEEAASFIKNDQEVIKTKKKKFIKEEPFTLWDGSRKWFQTTKVPLDLKNNPNCLLGVSVEITDRKLAEDALKESEKRFRTLFEQAAVGVAIIDSKSSKIIRINQHYCDIVGYTIKEMESINFQKITHPDYSRLDLNNMKKINDGKIRKFSMEKRYIKKDGSIVWVNLIVSPMWAEGKEPDYHIAIVKDITKRKRAEEQIQKDLKEKEVLLKEIHHRVKNNLNVITSLLSLQAEQISSKKQALDAFNESKNRIYAMALVHESLYGSKDFSNINMKLYIETMCKELLQASTYKKKIRLEFNIHNMFLNINYAVPCGLILNELLTNAIKHAFPGRKQGQIRIDFRVWKNQKYELIFRDNGIGLPENIDIYNTESLGLKIVNILTEQIDGVLNVKRKSGTLFQIKFNVS